MSTFKYSDMQLQEIERLSDAYRFFLNKGKTERECVAEAIRLAEGVGYRPLEYRRPVNAGDRVYLTRMGKTIALFHIGEESLENGINVLGAHIDSPRLDGKQLPLYEAGGFAYLDLHYYGWIKKYQWVTIPLAIHGVVILKDGSIVPVVIGEEKNDPIFCVTDLLPHFASEQLALPASKVIDGEAIDLLLGTTPEDGAQDDSVQKHMAHLLKEKYGFSESDFLSAELEVVPAGEAREAGLDKSMIFAYGQDDRSCAFASLSAFLQQDTPKRTSCCILVDKEEIGSFGATGAQSFFFRDAVADVLAAAGFDSEWSLRRCLHNSVMLSSDVAAAFDPLYSSVFEKRTSAFLGRGVNFNKYTGSNGKEGTNDASPEFIAQLRRIMDESNVHYQLTEFSKVDIGLGGTIASMFAHNGLQVIDCGVPVLSMHSPGELIGKTDLYEAWKCYGAFLRCAQAIR